MIEYLVTAVFGAGLLSASVVFAVYLSYVFVHYRWDQKVARAYQGLMTQLDRIKRL